MIWKSKKNIKVEWLHELENNNEMGNNSNVF